MHIKLDYTFGASSTIRSEMEREFALAFDPATHVLPGTGYRAHLTRGRLGLMTRLAMIDAARTNITIPSIQRIGTL